VGFDLNVLGVGVKARFRQAGRERPAYSETLKSGI